MPKEPLPVGRPSVLRHTNALSVLKLLRQAGSCSRADLVRSSGLSAPTITNVVRDLLAENLIEPLGEGQSSGGRPPDMIRFKAERGCVLGVEITAAALSFLLTDLSGKELGQQRVSLVRQKTTPEAICAIISAEARQLLRKCRKTRDQLLVMVVGVPAITNVDDGVVLAISTLEGWSSVPLRTMLRKSFGCLIIIENDTNLAAQGERYCGAARTEDSFILITIGTGIGAGIVLNGKIHHGSQWCAGEIGYLRLPFLSRGRPTIHEFGEVDRLLSSSGILQSWNEATRKQRLDSRERQAGKDAISVLALAQDGNAYAHKIVLHRAGIITDIIVNLSLILNPSLILLSGAIGSHPTLINAVQKQLQECEFAVTKISAGALGDMATLWGAVSLALESMPLVLLPAS